MQRRSPARLAPTRPERTRRGIPDPVASALDLAPGEQWALDRVRRHGVGSFVALMTLVALVASAAVVAGSLLVLDALGESTDWGRSIAIGVVTVVLVGPPILLLSARLVSHLDIATALLQESVVTDPLTGVANRRGFFAALDAALDEVGGRGAIEVAMIDVDDFKAINDARGHATGDTALCMVAAWLEGVVGDRGTVGRLGGDEFAYVAPVDPGRPAPTDMVFRLDGIVFSVSVGSAVTHDGDLQAALVAADAELYRRKQSRIVAPRTIVRSDQRGGPDE